MGARIPAMAPTESTQTRSSRAASPPARKENANENKVDKGQEKREVRKMTLRVLAEAAVMWVKPSCLLKESRRVHCLAAAALLVALIALCCWSPVGKKSADVLNKLSGVVQLEVCVAVVSISCVLGASYFL